MMDDFFQKKAPSWGDLKRLWRLYIVRGLLYISIFGFLAGLIFGYLYVKGWISTADQGLVLYAVTFGVGALLSFSFVLYQFRQSQQKLKKVKIPDGLLQK